MRLFFDTSALVKFYHEEDGTDIVSDLIRRPGNMLHISELAKLEFVSALHRRFRTGELKMGELNDALSAFSEDIRRFNIEPLPDTVINEAKLLILEHGKYAGLRALDALQLASFVLLNLEDGVFVAADSILIDVAERMGLKTFNPLG